MTPIEEFMETGLYRDMRTHNMRVCNILTTEEYDKDFINMKPDQQETLIMIHKIDKGLIGSKNK